MRGVASLAGLVADATAGALVTRGGRVTGLPALPGHQALAAGSPVLMAALSRLTASQQYLTFLFPAGGELVKLTALAVPDRRTHVGAVVLLSPPPPLVGLTRRELEVLGGLAEGWSTARIAAGLAVRGRTVTAHIERILFKLGASSRTLAAVRAVRRGLYVPVELTVRRGRAAAS
jgi:DNA-binding NarL/FixJ family response regulator